MSETEKLVGPVVRAVRLLQVFAEADSDLSIKDLAERTGLAPSTVHRLVNLLAEQGVVAIDGDHKRYGVGTEFIRIAALVASRSSLADIVRPFMERIVAGSGETCVYVSYLRPRRLITVLEAVNSPNPLQYKTELYSTRSPLWGATGQSVVAFLPRAEQEELYDGAVGQVFAATGAELPPRAAYFAQMDRFRAQGYALSSGQTIPGAVGIGAPVFDKSGQVIGSLCVTVPDMRFTDAIRDHILGVLVPEAKALSASLGYRG